MLVLAHPRNGAKRAVGGSRQRHPSTVAAAGNADRTS
jgi:hypothetical protein